MPLDVDQQIRRISYGAQSQRAQLKRMIGNLINPHRTAQMLFYGADGQLKPEAVEWLARIAREAFVDRSTFDADPRIHAKNEGRRELALEILGSLRLDTAKLDRLTRQLKESDDE